jgi:NAD-dependent dihydropyrimidine dehydrogenase PreA subunit
MTYVIAQPCVDVKDRACLVECPVDCIYEGERTLYIHPAECVDCHACEPVCPVDAIFPEAELPQHWSHYLAVNAEFFAPPAGAGEGAAPADHPVVAALPPQHAHRREIAAFSARREEADVVDLWFPAALGAPES